MSINKPVQLGLCCLNLTLREQKPSIFASRSCILKTVETKGIDIVKQLAIENLKDLLKMIQWNEDNGIKVFRLSSDIFPHFSNPRIARYTLDFAKKELEEVGALAKRYNMRLTFHPGQYDVLGTTNKDTLEKTILDLQCHADIMDAMNLPIDSTMVIHGGGLYGNKEKTIERWIENYNNLSESIKRRLTLENCEKCFHVDDCLKVSKVVNIPVVFDTHHFTCYKQLHPNEEFRNERYYIPQVLETWKRRGIKPEFHVSEQGCGRVGHHSDYIETIPEFLLEIPKKYGVEIDIMVEAKMKELAVFHLYKKYPYLNCKKTGDLVYSISVEIV